MAGAHCATIPFLVHPILPVTGRTKLLVSASVSVPTRRKNYLRPKILKTLTKPDPQPASSTLHEQSIVPVESAVIPTQDNHELEQGDVVAGEGTEVEGLRVSVTTAEYNGISGKISARTVLKYGVYFVGLFVLQTFVSVLFLGDSDPDGNRNSKSSKGGVLNTSSGSELGNVVHFDESQLGEKIEEIRAMARKARKAEKRESKGSIGNEDDAFSISKDRVGIEKEVGDRLVKLQKRLSSKREKLPGSFVHLLEMFANFEDGVSKNNENVKEGNVALMFKKKLKFKTPTAEVKRNPKGFGVLEENGGSTKKKRGGSTKKKRGSDGVDAIVGNASVGTDGMELLDAVDGENPRESSEKGTGRLDEAKGIEAGNIEPQNGTVHRIIRGRSSPEGVKSSKSRGFGKKNPPSLKEIQETTVKSNDPAVLSVNGSSIQKEAENQALANKVSGKQSDNETDPWWLDLPYVLVIFMRRGSDGQGGLFSVELNSQSQNQNDASYTVAFEDRVDANNFCFLLESCFEDQDDFRANAAPLPNKELYKAVKSDNMKVIVVKKGQLQLYAGQPFAEVELALRSLVLQN